jgi:hypothetical protein
LDSARLLHDVRHLVGEQLTPRRSLRTVFTLPKKDVRTDGESASVKIPAELIGLGIGVRPNAAEISAKRRFHSGANAVAQCLSATRRALNTILDLR